MGVWSVQLLLSFRTLNNHFFRIELKEVFCPLTSLVSLYFLLLVYILATWTGFLISAGHIRELARPLLEQLGKTVDKWIEIYLLCTYGWFSFRRVILFKLSMTAIEVYYFPVSIPLIPFISCPDRIACCFLYKFCYRRNNHTPANSIEKSYTYNIRHVSLDPWGIHQKCSVT